MSRLSITRKPGESVRVDGPATVIVVRCNAGRVQLCVEADRSVRVLRSELTDRKEGQEAA